MYSKKKIAMQGILRIFKGEGSLEKKTYLGKKSVMTTKIYWPKQSTGVIPSFKKDLLSTDRQEDKKNKHNTVE